MIEDGEKRLKAELAGNDGFWIDTSFEQKEQAFFFQRQQLPAEGSRVLTQGVSCLLYTSRCV